MNIAILSRDAKIYSTKRLKAAAVKRGHKVRILDPMRLSIDVKRNQPHLYYNDRPLPKFDAVIPRIGASITFFGTAVTRQFEQMGVYTLNSSLGITISRDKLRSLQVLSRHNIGVPHTIFVKNRDLILPTMDRLKDDGPVIIKLLEGTQGIGVILADSKKVAEAIVETLQSTKQNVLIQEFIKESQGTDIRAFVVGGKVIAAMRRVAKQGEFRSNIHRGASMDKLELSPEFEETAVKATQIMGLNVAGVDMLESNSGPMVLEVNSSPGLEGIEAATGVDVAAAMIEQVEDQVLLPELDIRQRLTLRSGYGVVELTIDGKSPLCGKTIEASGIRDKDILVLSLTRGKDPIPNPKGTRKILAGDMLLCFGNLQTLKGFVPVNKRKGRKKQ